jgi:hypothetical protein
MGFLWVRPDYRPRVADMSRLTHGEIWQIYGVAKIERVATLAFPDAPPIETRIAIYQLSGYVFRYDGFSIISLIGARINGSNPQFIVGEKSLDLVHRPDVDTPRLGAVAITGHDNRLPEELDLFSEHYRYPRIPSASKNSRCSGYSLLARNL